MVMTPAHDILLQGDFGTRKVVLAISVCGKRVPQQKQLKETLQALLVFTLEMQSCECHARQSVGEKPPGILVEQRREPVFECWVDGLLFPFI